MLVIFWFGGAQGVPPVGTEMVIVFSRFLPTVVDVTVRLPPPPVDVLVSEKVADPVTPGTVAFTM
jgi:hypothetical protein